MPHACLGYLGCSGHRPSESQLLKVGGCPLTSAAIWDESPDHSPLSAARDGQQRTHRVPYPGACAAGPGTLAVWLEACSAGKPQSPTPWIHVLDTAAGLLMRMSPLKILTP